MGTDLEPMFVPERPGDIKNSTADITKANSLIDYTPLFYVDEGLKIATDWYKAQFQRD